MPIIVNLDVMLAKRKRRLNELAEAVGVTAQNLSILKTGKARAVRFSTLEAICEFLECQPGDILEHREDTPAETPVAETARVEAAKPVRKPTTEIAAAERQAEESKPAPKPVVHTVEEVAAVAGSAAVAPIDDDMWKKLTKTPWKR